VKREARDPVGQDAFPAGVTVCNASVTEEHPGPRQSDARHDTVYDSRRLLRRPGGREPAVPNDQSSYGC